MRHILLFVLLGHVAVSSPASGALTSSNAVSVCRYDWSSYATGWRTRTWQPWNCSNGLPVPGALALGQARNGAGTAGQAACSGSSGGHYNHPTSDGATSGHVDCLFVPPAASNVQPNPRVTLCRYTWSEYATGWRWRTWQESDCSHGLPAAGSYAIGQGQNGGGTEGQVACYANMGGHYNHPSVDGATTGTVSCLFVAAPPVADPELTLCQYTWSEYATGWRTRVWQPSDCSHGLPRPGSVAIGQAQNGNGTAGQVDCSVTQGSHYNHPTQAGATSGTVRCLFARRPPPPDGAGYAHDLDTDGVRDANLSVVTCAADPSRRCLRVDSWLFSPAAREVPLHPEARSASGELAGVVNWQAPLRVLGDHNADGLAEVSVLHVRERTANGATYHSPALAVADPDARALLADAAAPVGLTGYSYGYRLRSFAAYPRDPGGRVYPALLPGYGDSNAEPTRRWGYGCLFKPGASSSQCGANFMVASTEPGPLVYGGSWFRETGGYLQDVDADGWEDIHLLYHWGALALSPRTGLALATTTYDVAQGAAPVGFHSGRNYGTHAASRTGGVLRTAMVAGSPVGDFDNYFCNVSRWVGLIEQPGAPSTRALRWSSFRGFHSNIWTSYPYVPPGGSAPTPARWGDFANQCFHRYSDSRSVMDGAEVLVVNYFAASYAAPENAALSNRCKDEQYQLYLDPAWTQPKVDAWTACARQHLGAKGRWGMQVSRASDGAGLTGSQDTYVWGWSSQLLPGGEIVYLVEDLPSSVRFDLRQSDGVTPLPRRQLRVLALVGGLWSSRGVLPEAGRPVLVDVPKEGPLGTGDDYPVKALSLSDRDGDGLMELLLERGDGSRVWVGYSSAVGGFVVKP